MHIAIDPKAYPVRKRTASFRSVLFVSLLLTLLCVGFSVCLGKNLKVDEDLEARGHQVISMIRAVGVENLQCRGGWMLQTAPGDRERSHAPGHEQRLPHQRALIIRNPIDTTTSLTYRIVSLSPINPDNRPYLYERQALVGFEYGVTKDSLRLQKNGAMFFYYMEPLLWEDACVSCHSEQGARVGGVCGGISICFNIDQVISRQRARCYIMFGSATAILLLGLYGYSQRGAKAKRSVRR